MSHSTNLPTLWGDGVHDDTPAIRALAAGKPYIDMRSQPPGAIRNMPDAGAAPQGPLGES